MSGRWKFSVTIPSWTQTALEGDELVVFYRVEIKITPSDGKGIPKSRAVLRRYNHFHKLHSKIAEELGSEVLEEKEVPSKRSILKVNKRPELVERRRKDLEKWLWKLVNDPNIAKSQALNNFLELSDAAKLVSRTPAGALAIQKAESALSRPYTMSEGGSSPRGSEASGFTSNSRLTDYSRVAESASSMQAPLPLDLPLDRFSLDGKASQPLLNSHNQANQPILPQTDANSHSLDPSYRLGLRVDQRGHLKQLVRDLQHRLSTASADFQNAVEAIEAEKEAKRDLARRVAYLEEELGSDHFVREAELERLLQQVAEMDTLTSQAQFLHQRKPSEGVNSLQEVSKKLDLLKTDLEDTRKARDNLQEQNTKLSQNQLEEVAALREGHAGKIQQMSKSHKQSMQEMEDAHAQEIQKLEAEADEKLAKFEAQAKNREEAKDREWMSKLASLQERLDAQENERQIETENRERDLQKALDEAKQKSVKDMKVLAKEVKTLRKQIADFEGQIKFLKKEQSDLETLKLDFEKLQASLQEESQKSLEANEMVLSLRNEKDSISASHQSQYESLQREIQEREKELSEIKEKLLHARSKTESSQTQHSSKLRELEDQLKLERKALADSSRSALEAQTQAQEYKEKIKSLEERLTAISSQLQESDANFASAMSQQEEEDARLMETEGRCKNLISQVEGLQVSLIEKDADLRTSQKELKKLSDDSEKLRSEIHKSKSGSAQLEQAKRQLESFKTNSQNLELKLKHAEEQMKNAEHAMQEKISKLKTVQLHITILESKPPQTKPLDNSREGIEDERVPEGKDIKFNEGKFSPQTYDDGILLGKTRAPVPNGVSNAETCVPNKKEDDESTGKNQKNSRTSEEKSSEGAEVLIKDFQGSGDKKEIQSSPKMQNVNNPAIEQLQDTSRTREGAHNEQSHKKSDLSSQSSKEGKDSSVNANGQPQNSLKGQELASMRRNSSTSRSRQLPPVPEDSISVIPDEISNSISSLSDTERGSPLSKPEETGNLDPQEGLMFQQALSSQNQSLSTTPGLSLDSNECLHQDLSSQGLTTRDLSLVSGSDMPPSPLRSQDFGSPHFSFSSGAELRSQSADSPKFDRLPPVTGIDREALRSQILDLRKKRVPSHESMLSLGTTVDTGPSLDETSLRNSKIESNADGQGDSLAESNAAPLLANPADQNLFNGLDVRAEDESNALIEEREGGTPSPEAESEMQASYQPPRQSSNDFGSGLNLLGLEAELDPSESLHSLSIPSIATAGGLSSTDDQLKLDPFSASLDDNFPILPASPSHPSQLGPNEASFDSWGRLSGALPNAEHLSSQQNIPLNPSFPQNDSSLLDARQINPSQDARDQISGASQAAVLKRDSNEAQIGSLQGRITEDSLPSISEGQDMTNHAAAKPEVSMIEQQDFQQSSPASNQQINSLNGNTRQRQNSQLQKQPPETSGGKVTSSSSPTQAGGVGGFMTRWGLSLPNQDKTGASLSKGSGTHQNSFINRDKIDNFARNYFRKSGS